MTDQAQNLLSALSNELSENQFDAAQETVSDLSALYDDRQEEESRRSDQSRSLFFETDAVSIAEAVELDALARVNGTTQFTRATLLTVVTGIVELHEELAEEGQLYEALAIAQAAIDELLDAESELEEQASTTQDILDTSTIPPSVRISVTTIERQTITVDGETSVTVRIRNSGDSEAEGVTIETEPSAGLDITPQQISIGSLPGDTRLEETISISGVSTGSQAIEIEVRSENAGNDLATGLITVAEDDRQRIEDYTVDGQVVLAGLRTAITDWRTDDISDSLLVDVTDAWRTQKEVE